MCRRLIRYGNSVSDLGPARSRHTDVGATAAVRQRRRKRSGSPAYGKVALAGACTRQRSTEMELSWPDRCESQRDNYMPLDDNWTGFSPSKRYSGDLPEISWNTSARKGGLKRNRVRQAMRGKPRDPWQGGHGPRCIPVEASARRDLSPNVMLPRPRRSSARRSRVRARARGQVEVPRQLIRRGSGGKIGIALPLLVGQVAGGHIVRNF